MFRITTNPVPAPAQPAASSSSGFVFGQNLSERVVIENMNNGEVGAVDHSSANGTTDLLFTSAAASVKENQDEARTSSPLPTTDGSSNASGGTGLAAAAAEYERSHARPPPPAAQYNLTGEEGEVNVLQISCRLFAWEGGSWRERGRGVLRLNEAEPSGDPPQPYSARLVCRVAGSLRVVLNTKLWADMVVERAGTKSLRITAATEEQQIKLYLIMGAPADIVQLYRALSTRVANIKRTQPDHAPLTNTTTPAHCNTSSQQAAERLEAQHLDENTDDKNAEDKNPEETNPNDNNPGEETEKPLKRKEPVEDEVTPKRQCPE
ncbi:ran-binding protein 3 [Phthorimaea operculella]|nr:ran-binding protein 3 [Phthorimaea operculella]